MASMVGWMLAAWFVAVMLGWAPNPADRLFEVGPRTYRNYADVLQASGSPQLRAAIKHALEEDGRLTQANLTVLQPFYERALPIGYVFAEHVPNDVAVERLRLFEIVGVKPKP